MALKRLMLILLFCAGLTTTAQRPEDWVGAYRGYYISYNNFFLRDTIYYKLTISSNNKDTLKLFSIQDTYQLGIRGSNSYLVKDTINPNKYYFTDDESRLIFTSNFIGNKLISVYESDSVSYINMWYIEGNELVNENISWPINYTIVKDITYGLNDVIYENRIKLFEADERRVTRYKKIK